MGVSYRVKRNISLVLTVIGVVCIVARIWGVVMEPTSWKPWLELFGIVIITYLCFDNYRTFRRKASL